MLTALVTLYYIPIQKEQDRLRHEAVSESMLFIHTEEDMA
jgi:hypothetical protein